MNNLFIKNTSTLLFLFLSSFSVFGQQADRDAIKIGYLHTYFAQDDVARPALFVEYSRAFYPPLTLGVSGGISTAKGLETLEATQDLLTFHLDLNLMYPLLENNVNAFHIGIGLSARSFQYQGVDQRTNVPFKNNALKPGVGALVDYQYEFEPLMVGIRGSLQSYSEQGLVYGFGGFLGMRF